MTLRAYITGLVVIAAIFHSGCQTDTEETAPQLSVEWAEVQIIGDDDSQPESLLSAPTHVAVNEDGTVFVHDVGQDQIQVYDSDGNYQRAIGQRGQGPGEFERVNAMTLSADGNLVVYDGSQRRMTRFDLSGEVIDQRTMETWLSVLLADGKDFLAGGRSQIRPENGYFRRLAPDFTLEGTEFAFFRDFFDFGDPVANGRIDGPVALSADGESLFWVDHFYSGFIRTFERTPEGWQVGEPLQGRTIEPAYVELTGRELQEGRDRVYMSVVTQDGEIGVEVFCWSVGLIKQPEGQLLHFFVVDNSQGEQILNVELFEADGTYRGFAELVRRPDDEVNGPSLRVEAQDEAGRLYVIDRANSVVRVFELSIHE